MQNNPTRLSISELARTVDMSVQNLRKTYINKGKISISKDARGMPYVELSECLRVFPDRFKSRQPSAPVDNGGNPEVGNQVAQGFHELLAQNGALETELATIKERLQNEETRRIDAEKREAWMRNHVDQLTEENLKLLGAPKLEKSGWWARIFSK